MSIETFELMNMQTEQRITLSKPVRRLLNWIIIFNLSIIQCVFNIKEMKLMVKLHRIF